MKQKNQESQQQLNVESYEFEPIKGYPMLNWKGKRPFTSTQYFPAQLKESYGKPGPDSWMNKIFWGDNLQVMSHLLKEYRGKVDLIYIDPPFDSKADYKKTIKIKGDSIRGDSSVFEEKQYGDIWSDDEYLQFIYDRMILLKELLSSKGVIFVHCDWHRSHHIRCIMDEVFGHDRFNNEIVWHYYNKMQGNINRFASNHDTILSYRKCDKAFYKVLRELREQPKKQQKRIWDSKTQSLIQARDENGNLIYYDDTHRTIDDVWRLPYLMPADKKEPVGYPTQKPESLIERIIASSSNENDLVFDCFMGSGTTMAVAQRLSRRFIGADINAGAISITTKRLLDIRDSFEGLQIYNVNNYDIFRNPIEAKDILLASLEVSKISNSIFDGEKDGRMVKIMPVNRIASNSDLNDLITGIDRKTFEKRQKDNPNKPVEKILLVCMGHEPDLKAHLEKEVEYKLDIEIVDILRDKQDLQFKRESEAKIKVKKDKLTIDKFFPMNLLQKLSLQKEKVTDWRELVESVLIDWNYDGAVLEPQVIDIPEKEELVKGEYEIPKDAGTIRVKITDLLSESIEVEVSRD